MFEAEFVEAALKDEQALWTSHDFMQLASRSVPDEVLGRRAGLLRSDLYVQWARWFVEGLADPSRYLTGPRTTYSHIYADVYQAIQNLFPNRDSAQRQQLSSAAAQSVLSTVSVMRHASKRRSTDREERLTLIDIAGSVPRCWICGASFSGQAIQNFVEASVEQSLQPSLFVDVLKPNGLRAQDLRIELDHAFPFSAGGDDSDNLRLACGWCNRHKGARLSLYDVGARPLLAGPNRLGLSTLPHQFWTVRLLAIQRKCEAHHDCVASSDTHEMTVAPISPAGAFSPSNLRVTCPTHDPLGSSRLQGHDVVSALWRTRTRD